MMKLRPSSIYFFKLTAVVTLLICCALLMAGRFDEEFCRSVNLPNCERQSFSETLTVGASLGYQNDSQDDLKTEDVENSNVSVIRRMFGPPRSKPTSVLKPGVLGNFETDYHYKLGPGENGTPVYLPKDKMEDGRKSVKEFGLNDEVSKLIAMNRSLPDSRPDECKYWHYDMDLPSASVVVVFHNEGFHTLLRTIHSINNTSPARYLKQIIMVDDYSDKEALKTQLDNYLVEHFGSLVKLHRNSKREGLIRSRTIGAKIANSEVVVFMDAHCECNRNWLIPLLARVAYDPTIMAVPIADVIDQDTFAHQTLYKSGFHQGIFEWGLRYDEARVPDKDLKRRKHFSEPYWSPTFIGFAMALNREFFFALGAYDPGLEIWGGEQFEQSFKIWQCGGSIEWVPCSHVAHVYRRERTYGKGEIDPKQPTFSANDMRVVEVWMDPEYREYFYTRQPDMRGYPIGDLTEQLALKKRLRCKSFKYFLDNFASAVLIKRPPLPKNVAWGEVIWKDGTTDLCWGKSRNSSNMNVTLARCHHSRVDQMFRFNAEGQLATQWRCVIKTGDALRVVDCPSGKPIGDFQYEPVTRLIRHLPTNKCVEGVGNGKELRLRPCNTKEIQQKWKVQEVYPKK